MRFFAVVSELQGIVGQAFAQGDVYEDLVTFIWDVRDRLHRGALRSVPLSQATATGMAREWQLAGRLLDVLAKQLGCAVPGSAERAYIAMWLHGWLQDLSRGGEAASATAPLMSNIQSSEASETTPTSDSKDHDGLPEGKLT